MAPFTSIAKLASIFRDSAPVFWYLSPQNAQVAYDGSVLQEYVDAIAYVSRARRDKDGSFEVTIRRQNATDFSRPIPGEGMLSEDVTRTENEKTVLAFSNRTNLWGYPVITIKVSAALQAKEQTELLGGSILTRQFKTKTTGDCKLRGDTVDFLEMELPFFIPFVGGSMNVLKPEVAAQRLMVLLFVAAPSLHREILSRVDEQNARAVVPTLPLQPL